MIVIRSPGHNDDGGETKKRAKYGERGKVGEEVFSGGIAL